MAKEKISKTAAVLIIVAFIIGAALGYIIKTEPETSTQFKTGDNILKNSGFENEVDEEPAYWYQAIIPADNLTINLDYDTKFGGGKSAYASNEHEYAEPTCNNWMQTIETLPHGKNVVLSGWVKTIEAYDVVMIVQCWSEDNEMVAFGTTGNINGTNDWTEYKANVLVPETANTIIVRLALCGTGQVWFDDVELKIE